MTRPLSPATLQRLADSIADPMPAEPRTDYQRAKVIIREVSIKHHLRPSCLIGPSMDAQSSVARHEAQWRIRNEMTPRPTLGTIGKWFGRRDHSSVYSGIKAHEARIAEQRTEAQ